MPGRQYPGSEESKPTSLPAAANVTLLLVLEI